MHSGTVSGKSFTMFTLNQGLLARCVEAVKEGDALARKTGQIQSFEIFRNGFRMNLIIGRIMVIPPSVCDDKEDFPVALLYGALVRELRPEDLADLMAAKIGDSEFDEYSEADMGEIKEKLFQIPGTKKYTSLVLFLPSWTAPREYVMFKYTKDDNALANALRHLVFAAYYDPRLSSAFNHIMQDTDTVNHGTELDVTNITPKLNYPGVAEGARNEYPDLQSADEQPASQDLPTGPGSKKKKKASEPKRKIALSEKFADAISADELERGEVDVISAVTDAAEAAILNKRDTVSDAAADDNAAKHAAVKPKYAGQVPCPYCKHSEPTTDDLEDHVARAHKNASKTAQLGHTIMEMCQGKGNHSACPGVVEGIHCDCECHEKAEQEGNIGTTKSGGAHDEGVQKNIDAIKAKGHPCPGCGKQTDAKICPSCLLQGKKAAEHGNTPLDQEISALFKKKEELAQQGKDKIKGGEYDAVLKELQQKTRARLGALKKIQAGDVSGLGEMKVKMKLNLDELPEKAQEKVVDGATNAAKNMGDAETKTASMKCECADPGCPMHQGTSNCDQPAAAILYRVDMEDETGTPMCEECAMDAADSGVFRVEEIENSLAPMLSAEEDDDAVKCEGCGKEHNNHHSGYVSELCKSCEDKEKAKKKTADTADNPANEKGGEGAIKVKTETDISNTRGSDPEYVSNPKTAEAQQGQDNVIPYESQDGMNPGAKQAGVETKTFDTSNEAGIKAAERYKARLENAGYSVTTVPAGLNSVRITGKTATAKVAYVSHVPGHTNSKGEAAPWVIKQHNTGKILESFKSESAAKEGLKNMESHKHGAETHEVDLGSKGSFETHPGALHKALGIPEDQTISEEKLHSVMNGDYPEHVKNMARSAIGLKHMHKGSFTLTAEFVRKAAISVGTGEDAQGFYMAINMNGREYALRGNDAQNFRQEYNAIAKPPAQVNALVEKYMGKLQSINQKPAAPAQPKNIHTPSAPGQPDITSWLKRQPALASLNLVVYRDGKKVGTASTVEEAKAKFGSRSIIVAGGHKPGCECGFCKNKGNLPGAKKDEKEKDEKTAAGPGGQGAGTQGASQLVSFPPNLANKDDFDINLASLAVRSSTTTADAMSRRAANVREDHEAKLAKLRRTVVADESDDIFAEVTEPFGAAPQVKVKDGDGRPDGATPKLADAGAMDWFITDRDEQGQPKENVPEKLVIPESEPVTGVYDNDTEGADPVGQALQSVTTDVKAPADLGESKATDVKEPLDLNGNEGGSVGQETESEPNVEEAAARWLGDESVEEEEAEEPQHINASMTMKCPRCKGQASKPAHGEPYSCSCGWHSTEPKVSTPKKASRKYASDRIIATLDDLLDSAPFDPVNEERPDSSLLEGLVSGPLKGGTHETNDTAGPANKVADFDTKTPTSDSQVVPNKVDKHETELGGPQNTSERPNVDAVREQIETAQEMDKHETIEEKEAEVHDAVAEEVAPEVAAEEEGTTSVVTAPAGSGQIVININAAKEASLWLKAHGLFDDDTAEPITSGSGGGGQQSTAGPSGAEGMPNLEASNDIAITADSLAVVADGQLAKMQQDFFTDAADTLAPHLTPNFPVGGGDAAGGIAPEAAELALVAGKTAERGIQPSTNPSKDYNGWHNWETWHVALLIDNEQPLHEAKRNLARRAIKDAKGGEVNIAKLADQISKVCAKAYKDTKAFYESNAREMPDTAWATEPFEEVNWYEIAQNAVSNEEGEMEYAARPKVAPTASVKTASAVKESGFNFFFPGQVLKEFYPEVQHEIVDYPNADNKPMIQDVDLAPSKVGSIQKEACGCDEVRALENMYTPIEEKKQELRDEMGMKEAGVPNYVSTDPAAIGIGRDGKPQVLEGAPLRKENDIRGPMFSEEFYAASPSIPGKALQMASLSISDFKKKAAASADQKEMLGDFLKKVMGEIACTFVAAFKVTSRPVDLDQIPGTGEVNLVSVENSVNNWPFYAGEVGGRVKYLLEQMNDSDIQDAINDAWSQAAVWHNGSGSGNFTYEVFVRAEAIDTDSMKLKYKFVTGTKGE